MIHKVEKLIMFKILTKKSAFILFIVIFVASCKIQEVEIGNIQKLRIGDIKKDKISLQFKIPIKNPNNFKFKLSKVDLDLSLNNSELGKIRKIRKIVVPANSNDVHDFYIEIEYKKLLSGTVALVGGLLTKKARVKLNGYVKVKAFCILSKKIEIHENNPVKLFNK